MTSGALGACLALALPAGARRPPTFGVALDIAGPGVCVTDDRSRFVVDLPETSQPATLKPDHESIPDERVPRQQPPETQSGARKSQAHQTGESTAPAACVSRT